MIIKTVVIEILDILEKNWKLRLEQEHYILVCCDNLHYWLAYGPIIILIINKKK